MRPPDPTIFEATSAQLEHLVLLALLGALEALRVGDLREEDAHHLLIQPTGIESFERAGLSGESLELLEEALALEDVRAIRPNRYEPLLDELRQKALCRLAELPPLDLQAPRWFCAEADRRAVAAFRAQDEAGEVES